MNQKTDVEIVVKILKGDRQSYAQIIDAYKQPIFNLAYRMTGSYEDADDLTQEIFIRAYRKLHQFDQKKKFFTWLYTLGINLIRNHLRKMKREISADAYERRVEETHQQGNNAEGLDPMSDEPADQLDDYLLKLPQDVREVIILKYQQELSFEEVAAITGDKISAVKMRIYRGLEKLKYMMENGE